ncbi:unnamed protein product [Victoria cruziana]
MPHCTSSWSLCSLCNHLILAMCLIVSMKLACFLLRVSWCQLRQGGELAKMNHGRGCNVNEDMYASVPNQGRGSNVKDRICQVNCKNESKHI